MSNETRRISDADRAGFVVRSPEGHAAKSMNIKGQEEVWVGIQADTFKNWINVNLKEVGFSVDNLETDFQDGTKLVALVQVLQKRKLRHNKKPVNQHQELENISIALDAITEDGIKLVNIGNTDIHHGNVKLILGLLWCLISHYQLGASNFPPKKLMLAWLKAVLPDCKIKNFTSDWNNGLYLNALLNYCKPGLVPNWKSLNPNNGPANCRRAMEVAEKQFGIPLVLEPEYLASPHLDELSGMTYLSYFMKEEDSPGYYATLDWVKKQIPNHRVNNFRTDWNDGLGAAALVKAKGGPVPGYRDMDNYPESWVSNLELALSGGNKIGVPPVLEPKDMANPNVEYLGVMAWVAQFQWIPDRTAPGDRLEIFCSTSKARVGEECKFKIEVLDNEVDMDAITAEVIGPSGPVHMNFDLKSNVGIGSFRTEEMGMHEVLVRNEGEAVRGAPHFLRSMPMSKKDYDGIEPCAVGSTVEVLINPHHAARPELLEVTAYSPTNRPLGCPVSEENGTFYASFQPQEAGEWKIHVTYDNQDIDNSPFKCMVFNPRAIFIPDQGNARKARPGDPFTFTVDASKTGWGEVAIDVVFENRSIRRTFYVEEVGNRIYQVTFTPQSRGKHRVYVYLHGMEVKGSPFSLRIGKDVRETRKPAADIFKADRKVSRYKTHEESRAERRNFFSTKEIPIDAPVAPPRVKKDLSKRQSVREFREEQRQHLFKSEHRTESGIDLLPINKTIAFDGQHDERVQSQDDIYIAIKGPEGKKCPTKIRLNGNGTFTCEFTANQVGEHSIELVILDENINVTPTFHTFDASKIRVGPLPPGGFVGTPIDFEMEGKGAGQGKPSVVVNGGKVASHVSSSGQEQFTANFIPHHEGRFRIDIKFNGEKVQQSPLFVEVKDPNTPLMSPGLVNGKIHVSQLSGKTNGFKDHMEDSFESNDYYKSSNVLRSADFNKASESLNDELSSKLITTTTLKTTKTREKTSTTTATPVRNTIKKASDEDDSNVIRASISDKKVSTKMEPVKEFGSFSALLAPSLLSGKPPPTSEDTPSKKSTTSNTFSNVNNNSSNLLSSSKFSTSSFNSDVKEENLKYSSTLNQRLESNNNFESSYAEENNNSNRMFSTTISKTVNNKPSAIGSFNEERFIIKTEPGKNLTSSPTPRPRTSFLEKSPSPPRTVPVATSTPSEKNGTSRYDLGESSKITAAKSSYSSSSVVTSSMSRDQRSVSPPGKSKSATPTRKGSGSSTTQKSFIPTKKLSGEDSSSSLFSKSPNRNLSVSSTSTSSKIASKTSNATSTTAATGGIKSFSSASAFSETRSYSASSNKGSGTARASSPGKQKDSGKSAPNKGSISPKLPLYRGTADKCKFEGETVRHFNAGKLAVFELRAQGHKREDIQVNIISPEKRPHIPYKVVDEGSGRFRIEFTTVEVGSYVIDVTVNGLTVPSSPLIAKAYDAGLIKVTDITDGVVGVLSTFRVDASKAGEGQLEISINDGDVPNQVQVLGGGKCLVTYTPEHAITHEIEVTFNEEQVTGSPFLCRVGDGDADGFSGSHGTAVHSRVSVNLEHLGLIPINQAGHFTIHVAGGDNAELAVSVQGPTEDIPVKVTGNVKNGFNAEFLPVEVGIHMILVEYNGVAVGGTPFYSKVYGSDNVAVSDVPRASLGKTVTFAVDASRAGEGNLEIFVVPDEDRVGGGLPASVEPLGDAVFRVSFVPEVPRDHFIYVTFNDKSIPGSPFKSLAVDEFDKSNRNYSAQKILTEAGDISYSLRRVTETRSDFKGSSRH